MSVHANSRLARDEAHVFHRLRPLHIHHKPVGHRLVGVVVIMRMPVSVGIAVNNGFSLASAVVIVPSVNAHFPVVAVVDDGLLAASGLSSQSLGFHACLWQVVGNQVVDNNWHRNFLAEGDCAVAAEIAALRACHEIAQHISARLRNVERIDVVALLPAGEAAMIVTCKHLACAVHHVDPDNVKTVVATCILEREGLFACLAKRHIAACAHDIVGRDTDVVHLEVCFPDGLGKFLTGSPNKRAGVPPLGIKRVHARIGHLR